MGRTLHLLKEAQKTEKRDDAFILNTLLLYFYTFFFPYMSTSFWDAPLLSPLLVHMSNSLKRSRSTESLETAFKRSKPFDPEST